jgi:hypothetical protein
MKRVNLKQRIEKMLLWLRTRNEGLLIFGGLQNLSFSKVIWSLSDTEIS